MVLIHLHGFHTGPQGLHDQSLPIFRSESNAQNPPAGRRMSRTRMTLLQRHDANYPLSVLGGKSASG